MTTYDNRDRADRARTALQAYIEARGETFENSSSEIADLIADLMHLAAENSRPASSKPPNPTTSLG